MFVEERKLCDLLEREIKATVVYRCSKVTNRSRENNYGLQTKTEGNTSIIRVKQRNNRNTDVQQKQTPIYI